MELLSHILAQGEVQITFPQQNEPFTQIVEGQCYQALCKIKAIIEDDRLDDSECFQKLRRLFAHLKKSEAVAVFAMILVKVPAFPLRYGRQTLPNPPVPAN